MRLIGFDMIEYHETIAYLLSIIWNYFYTSNDTVSIRKQFIILKNEKLTNHRWEA